VVVELVVGSVVQVVLAEHEDAPEQDLDVGEDEDEEDEHFEVQLPVGDDAEGVADGQQEVPHNTDHPVPDSPHLRAEELVVGLCAIRVFCSEDGVAIHGADQD